mmetsp:Transcript_28015/g.110136  ORF Transcript_28015/g.110136 Transcript_28015/m.110136 type:complete len:109 (+) Transcript_28015:1765-2091(+)
MQSISPDGDVLKLWSEGNVILNNQNIAHIASDFYTPSEEEQKVHETRTSVLSFSFDVFEQSELQSPRSSDQLVLGQKLPGDLLDRCPPMLDFGITTYRSSRRLSLKIQ